MEEFDALLNPEVGHDEIDDDPLGLGFGLDEPGPSELSAPPEPPPVPPDLPQAAVVVQGPSEAVASFAGRAVDTTHSFGFKGGVLWCWKCGAWTAGAGSACMLHNRCREQATQGGLQVLRRVSANTPPHSSMREWPCVGATAPSSIRIDPNPLASGAYSGAVPVHASWRARRANSSSGSSRKKPKHGVG